VIFVPKARKVCERLRAVQDELTNPDVVKDQTQYQKLMKEQARLRPIAELFGQFEKTEREIAEAAHLLADKALDAEMRGFYEEELRKFEAQKSALSSSIEGLLLKESDPNASRDVIVEIRAGTGGEEAALFCANLFRMYVRYADEHGLTHEVMDSNPTGRGGFKEVIFSVTGADTYTLFKYESGIHRVQRVPETEASGRIHTSAVTVAILPEADESEIELDPSELKIDVYRASGAGGQHVNKTESAVRITHLPTGVVVTCQDERSQHKNKLKALRVLRARLFDAMQQKQHQELAKQRKEMVGSGDRSGKIRTYNYPDQRVTDHRIGLTLHALNDILDGHLDPVVQALEQNEKERRLADDVA
jgi:peptide chain release factor 1